VSKLSPCAALDVTQCVVVFAKTAVACSLDTACEVDVIELDTTGGAQAAAAATIDANAEDVAATAEGSANMYSRAKVVATTHPCETTSDQDAWVAHTTAWPTPAESAYTSDRAATSDAATSTIAGVTAVAMGTCVEATASTVIRAAEACTTGGQDAAPE
jgi:hypothetical protein